MPKVLISDKMDPKAAQVFKSRGVEVDEKPDLSPEELAGIIGDYDGLAVRSSTKVTPDLLDKADKLRVIGRAGIGVDNIDVDAASAKGVVVMNTPFGNSITTAEHAIAMMFALARQIPEANASTQAGKWEKKKFMGVELTHKTLGLIGCGNIGSIVAERAHGLRMRVIAYDPFLTEERAKELGVEKVDLDALLERADFITLHTPLTDQTRGILSADAFEKMKDGVRIINCARGGLIDESALKVGLESGKVGGAALDVYAEEPAKENALFGTPGLVCTPHLGASTTEAQVNVAIQVAEQMSDYLLDGGVSNALNMPSLSAEEAPKIRPYLGLADGLGSLLGQLTEGSVKGIAIEVEGAAAALNQKPITAAVLSGLLRTHSDNVNAVNAPVIARDRGIDVREIRHEREGAYHTLLRVSLETEDGEHSVAGTLFGEEIPRLVEIFGVKIEANLAGEMLYFVNEDKPGFIGALGSSLGDAGVNIGNFHLGRREGGGEAVVLLSLDAPLDEPVVWNVCNLPGVKRVRVLHF